MNTGVKQIAVAAIFSVGSATACALLALFVMYGSFRSGVGIAIAAALIYMAPLMAYQAANEKQLQYRADQLPLQLNDQLQAKSRALEIQGYGARPRNTGSADAQGTVADSRLSNLRRIPTLMAAQLL